MAKKNIVLKSKSPELDKDGFPILAKGETEPEYWKLWRHMSRLITGKFSSNEELRNTIVCLLEEFDKMVAEEEKRKSINE